MPSGNIQIKNRGGNRWAKGQSGNPRGRPKKADCLLDCIKGELSAKSLNGKQTNEQLIASVLVSMATRGSTKAIEIMMSYLHAKPTQGIDVTSKGNEIKQPSVIQVLDTETKDLFLNGKRAILETDKHLETELSGVLPGQTTVP